MVTKHKQLLLISGLNKTGYFAFTGSVLKTTQVAHIQVIFCLNLFWKSLFIHNIGVYRWMTPLQGLTFAQLDKKNVLLDEWTEFLLLITYHKLVDWIFSLIIYLYLWNTIYKRLIFFKKHMSDVEIVSNTCIYSLFEAF